MSRQGGSGTGCPVDLEKTPSHIGHGTEELPFIVEFQKDDPYNPIHWSQSRKWLITTIVSTSVFAVTFTSAAFASSAIQVRQEFNVSSEVSILGTSLFVLGFAVGPAIWAPLVSTSELYGRQILWYISHIAMVAFVGGSAGSRNIATLLAMQFLGGSCAGSPIINAGGTIADMFPSEERGVALTFYSIAPFLGPIVAPVVGGFIVQNVGWRWVQGVCCAFIGSVGLIGMIILPETYGPVLLKRRARELSKKSGNVFISILENDQGKKRPSEVFTKAIVRPWILLFWEPIVLVAAIYMGIILGTVYMFMAAMPIVYNEQRGWSPGIGGLAFMGIAVGIFLGTVYSLYDNKRYAALFLSKTATPESRLPPAMIGAVALPIGMFAFAWTNSPSIHWSASIILAAPFGIGCVLVILPMMNYLIDSYTIFAASVLAANALFRAIIGAVFPLFTPMMYRNLGIHWASSIPAFLTLACMPFPFVMYRYGEKLRMKCKYAFEAAEMLKQMRRR